MKSIPNRASTQLRIDETLYAKIKIIAEREHRYTNSQIEHCVDKYIKEYEAENGEIILPSEAQE